MKLKLDIQCGNEIFPIWNGNFINFGQLWIFVAPDLAICDGAKHHFRCSWIGEDDGRHKTREFDALVRARIYLTNPTPSGRLGMARGGAE